MSIIPATQWSSTAAHVPTPAPATTTATPTIPDAVPYTCMSGTGVPLSTGVDPKLKAKVWGDQYLPPMTWNAIYEAKGRWFHLL